MKRRAALSLSFALLVACGSSGSEGGSGGGTPDDGKFHPDPNGRVVAEAAACSTLVGAIQAKFQALSCVGTTRQCPDFLRTQFGQCQEYDEGTVAGCVAHYDEQASCDDLQTAIDDCVVATIAGSSGKGCP